MGAKRQWKPWRTIMNGDDEQAGRFTRTQIREGLRGECDSAEVTRRAARSDIERGGAMGTSRQRWPSIIMDGPTGRFSREEIDAAVDAVIAARARRALRLTGRRVTARSKAVEPETPRVTPRSPS
ncbi:MAG TPA: hypothetical protein VFQ39_20560 [Longimicrobium sp.]|nr:hypothetical protein [Longimicrobium sp.]